MPFPFSHEELLMEVLFKNTNLLRK